MMATRPSTPSLRSPLSSANEPIIGSTSNVRVAIRVRPLNKRGPHVFPPQLTRRNREEREMSRLNAIRPYLHRHPAKLLAP